MSDETYKLTYFGGRGRAEPIRLILTEAGQRFEDIRLTRDQWKTLKKDTPTGQLPVLEINGQQLCQSNSILRYLGRKFKMYSDEPWEQYRIDMIMDTVDDLSKKLIPAIFEKDPTIKASNSKEVEDNVLPVYKEILERELKVDGSGFFVGSKLTIADLMVFNILDITTEHFRETMEKSKELTEFKEKIETRPGIDEWIKNKRPKSYF